MQNKWQQKYIAEAKRIVVVMKRWHALESKIKVLEWELFRCLYPNTVFPWPKEVAKPSMLLRAEAGLPLMHHLIRGKKPNWKDRSLALASSIAKYNADNLLLIARAQRLKRSLAECQEAKDKEAQERAESTQHERVSTKSREDDQPPEPQSVPVTSVPSYQPLRERYEALKKEHLDLLQAKWSLELQLVEREEKVKLLSSQLEAMQRVVIDHQEAAKVRSDKQAQLQQHYDIVRELETHLRHGQRSFLEMPNAPDVDAELTGLVYYALTQLMMGLAWGDDIRVRAMYANLYTISHNLQSYNLVVMRDYDAALTVLRNLPGGDASHYAGQLPVSMQGTVAQPLCKYLKTIRDKASVELRPFYYNIDEDGRVLVIGC